MSKTGERDVRNWMRRKNSGIDARANFCVPVYFISSLRAKKTNELIVL